MKRHISCWMIYFACNTSVYQWIFTSDCSQFTQNIFLNDIGGKATSRTWWKHVYTFCPIFSGVSYSSSFSLLWRSRTFIQPVSVTSVIAKSTPAYFVPHLHAAALGVWDPWCYCQTFYSIDCLPPSCLHSDLICPSNNLSYANFWNPNCIQVYYLHQCELDDSGFLLFSGLGVLLFVLQRGFLQTKLVAEVTFTAM